MKDKIHCIKVKILCTGEVVIGYEWRPEYYGRMTVFRVPGVGFLHIEQVEILEDKAP